MSTSAPTNLLIFGATGLIGKFITEQLLLAKESKTAAFNRIAIFTSPGTVEKKGDEIEALKKRGVEIIVGDLEREEDVRKGYEGIDTIISAVGRNVILSQIPLLRSAASTPNIKRFFPSEYGTDIVYNASSAHEIPHQLKLKVRKFVETELEGDLEITYLVTGPYSDLFLGKGSKGNEKAGSFDVEERKAVVLGDGRGKVSFTSMRDVGVLLVAALLHPEQQQEGRNTRTLKVNSFTATPEEIVKEYERQMGEKWEVEYTSLDELKTREQEAWARGDALATLWTLRRIWAEGGTLYEERDNGRIGEPVMETLEEQVKKCIEKLLKV